MKEYRIMLVAITAFVWGYALLAWAMRKSQEFARQRGTNFRTVIIRRGPREQLATTKPTSEYEDITDNLLKFFELSSVSRSILRILAGSEETLSHADLTNKVNARLVRKGRRPVSEHDIRARVMNLMGASLAQLRNGQLSATAAGREVVARLMPPQAIATAA
jgi:hypothetical protein